MENTKEGWVILNGHLEEDRAIKTISDAIRDGYRSISISRDEDGVLSIRYSMSSEDQQADARLELDLLKMTLKSALGESTVAVTDAIK